MSLKDQDKLALVALNRFGLGSRSGSLGAVRADAKAALLAEVNTLGIAHIVKGTLPTYEGACRAVDRDFLIQDEINQAELAARIKKHMEPDIGFVERLVLFFSNHFSMSIDKDSAIRATIGQLERDVIRKNVLGSFKDMLLGVMKHPAMLRYLDNCDSIGPRSKAGKAWGAGLNHNLAREILELHTLGVSGGYTETDIDHLAAALTGWSYVRGWEADGHYNGGNRFNRGRFLFRAEWHEPGPKGLLGRVFSQTGVDQAVAMLAMLAVHPSTAQFLAFKLVRHFITDEPTPAMVDAIANVFHSTQGDLKAVAKALINLPEAWTLPLTKLRTPYELQIAMMRAMNRTYTAPTRWVFYSTLDALYNYPWLHPAPDGYSDESGYWMSPDAMRIRLETAQMGASTMLDIALFDRTPADLAHTMFGSAMADASSAAVSGTVVKRDGLATLFMLSEFQRR